MTWTNVLHYSGQVLGLLIAMMLLLRVLRVRDAALRVRLMQSALLACLILPFLQTKLPAAGISTVASQDANRLIPADVRTTIRLDAIWLAGTVAILLRLGFGLIALRRLRRSSRDFEVRHDVPIRLSSAINSPVAFGLFRPVVLLPETAASLSAELRDPMIAHEMEHIERSDWSNVLAEELIRAALWFHPAVWWTLARIKADRELAVDCKMAQQADPTTYSESLLTAAAWKAPNSYPATAMYSGGSLRRRLQLIANHKETYMTRLHRAAAVSALSIATLGVTGVVSSALPLFAGAAQEKEESTKLKLVKKVTPAYPPEAKEARIQGTVRLEVTVGKDGSVVNIKLENGHPLLAQAAVEAVQQWEFAPVQKNGQAVEVITTIDLNFTLSQ
jgi:TonB family protein